MSAQEAIGLFSICFYVSLAVMAVGFGFAAFAFFRYRIPQVFALMTGKAQRKTVEKMRSSGNSKGSTGASEGEYLEFTGETERLEHPPEFDQHPQVKEAMQHPVGGFETIEHLMVIHTDEEL